MAAQMPIEEKVMRADFVIDNDGDLERTRAQVRRVWKSWRGPAGLTGAAGAGHGAAERHTNGPGRREDGCIDRQQPREQSSMVGAGAGAAGRQRFSNRPRLLFAIDYTGEIAAAAAAYGLDPLLVAAVVKVESGFNERARSPKGALGLMQVMPETGAWVARQLSWPEFHPDMLYDPERNLTIGTWYLRHLANTFDGNLVVALAAYNAGQTRVQQWLAEQRWDGREETLADIPFGETRRYVRRVLDTMDTYIWLYDHGREQFRIRPNRTKRQGGGSGRPAAGLPPGQGRARCGHGIAFAGRRGGVPGGPDPAVSLGYP